MPRTASRGFFSVVAPSIMRVIMYSSRGSWLGAKRGIVGGPDRGAAAPTGRGAFEHDEQDQVSDESVTEALEIRTLQQQHRNRQRREPVGLAPEERDDQRDMDDELDREQQDAASVDGGCGAR